MDNVTTTVDSTATQTNTPEITNAIQATGQEPQQTIVEETQKPAQESAEAVTAEPAIEDKALQERKEAQELFNQRFAQLNKRQKEVQSQIEELKKLRSEVDPLIKLKQNPNPKKVLEFLGLPMDKFAKDFLSEPDEADPLVQRVLAAEKVAQEAARRLEEREMKDQEIHEQAQRRAVQALIKSEVDALEDLELVQSVPDRYEAIQEIIAQQYEKTGRMMSAKEAAMAMESYLEQEAKEKIMKSKKVRQWIAEADAGAKAPTQQAQGTQAAKTLTNSIPIQSTPAPEDEAPMEGESFWQFRERHLRKLASQIKGL